jgi:hypothetical protein
MEGVYGKEIIYNFTNYMGDEKQKMLKDELVEKLGGKMHIDNIKAEKAIVKYGLNPYCANILRALRPVEGVDTWGIKGNTRPEDGKPRTPQDFVDAAAGTVRNRWTDWTNRDVSGTSSKSMSGHSKLSADRPFLSFFSGDYCPVYSPMAIDHVNRNHEPNLRFFMKEETPESKEWRMR